MKFSRVRDFLRENAELSLGAAVLMLHLVIGQNYLTPFTKADAAAAAKFEIENAADIRKVSLQLQAQRQRQAAAVTAAPVIAAARPFNPLPMAVQARPPKPGRCQGPQRLLTSGASRPTLLLAQNAGPTSTQAAPVSLPDEDANRPFRIRRPSVRRGSHRAPFIDGLYRRNRAPVPVHRRPRASQWLALQPALGRHTPGLRRMGAGDRLAFLHNLCSAAEYGSAHQAWASNGK